MLKMNLCVFFRGDFYVGIFIRGAINQDFMVLGQVSLIGAPFSLKGALSMIRDLEFEL